MGEEHIAEEDADGVAPLGVGGGLVAAEFRAVDDVIVNERCDVDEFKDHCEIHVARRDFSRGPSRKKCQSRSQAFTARAADVGDITLHSGIERFGLGADALLNRVEVWINEFECLCKGEGIGVARGGCGHRTDFLKRCGFCSENAADDTEGDDKRDGNGCRQKRAGNDAGAIVGNGSQTITHGFGCGDHKGWECLKMGCLVLLSRAGGDIEKLCRHGSWAEGGDGDASWTQFHGKGLRQAGDIRFCG